MRRLLAERDLEGVRVRFGADQRTLKMLVSLSYDADAWIRYRAVEAIGRVCGVIAEADRERVRSFVRRLLWSMNDESGGVGWTAPETIGEILANVPSLIGELGVLLTAYLREEPFERGAHVAVARVAAIDPKPFTESAAVLAESLTDEDPCVRGHAALALGAIGATPHREAIRALQADLAPCERYAPESGDLEQTTVARLAERAEKMLDS